MIDVLTTSEVFAPYILGAILILLRLSTLTQLLPGMSQNMVPMRIRLLLLASMTFILDISLGIVAVPVPTSPFALFAMVMRELLIGAGMGLAVRFIFSAVTSAGAVAGVAMVLSLNTLVDPASGDENLTLGSLMGLSAALIFVSMDGQHVIITALHSHLAQYPVGVLEYTVPTVATIGKGGADLCATALLLAAPVVAVALLVNVALTLVSRVVPSVNIFGIGLGILTLAGLLSLGFEGDALVAYIERVTAEMPDNKLRWSGAQ